MSGLKKKKKHFFYTQRILPIRKNDSTAIELDYEIINALTFSNLRKWLSYQYNGSWGANQSKVI